MSFEGTAIECLNKFYSVYTVLWFASTSWFLVPGCQKSLMPMRRDVFRKIRDFLCILIDIFFGIVFTEQQNQPIFV